MGDSDDDDVSELDESDDADDVDDAGSGRFLRGGGARTEALPALRGGGATRTADDDDDSIDDDDGNAEAARERERLLPCLLTRQINRRNAGHHPCVRGREYSRASPRLRGM